MAELGPEMTQDERSHDMSLGAQKAEFESRSPQDERSDEGETLLAQEAEIEPRMPDTWDFSDAYARAVARAKEEDGDE